jgi:hypothetical protein
VRASRATTISSTGKNSIANQSWHGLNDSFRSRFLRIHTRSSTLRPWKQKHRRRLLPGAESHRTERVPCRLGSTRRETLLQTGCGCDADGVSPWSGQRPRMEPKFECSIVIHRGM